MDQHRIDIDACIRLARQERNAAVGKLLSAAWQGLLAAPAKALRPAMPAPSALAARHPALN